MIIEVGLDTWLLGHGVTHDPSEVREPVRQVTQYVSLRHKPHGFTQSAHV